jgi:hypothetical protein
LADKSFDNTGCEQDELQSLGNYLYKLLTLIEVLLEAPLDMTPPFDASQKQKNSVLLTIDLTKAVADEAIKNRNSVVVAYRKWYPI